MFYFSTYSIAAATKTDAIDSTMLSVSGSLTPIRVAINTITAEIPIQNNASGVRNDVTDLVGGGNVLGLDFGEDGDVGAGFVVEGLSLAHGWPKKVDALIVVVPADTLMG